jgi:hydrogenase expression/formation protein HypE
MSSEVGLESPLAVGKPPLQLLERLLARFATTDPSVIVGPEVGEDAAVLDLGDRYLVATTDPITFVTEEIGWYAVQVNANDLAVRGARPRWFLLTVLLPEAGADAAFLDRLYGEVAAACRAVGAAVVGGHTEVTHGLDRPILVGSLLGEVAKERLVRTSGAAVGDRILLSKGIAVEGASILARSCGARLAAAGLPASLLARARALLHDPGISVLREAEAALAAAAVSAMHDPTEGGLATALSELARAAKVGVLVRREAIPVLPECDAMCRALGLDPLGLIASGALLLTCRPEQAARVLEAWRALGVAGAQIGEIVPAEAGCRMVGAAGEEPLPSFARDEIARILEAGPTGRPAGSDRN